MIVRRLIDKVDVVLENFKPGTMERWGLGYEDLKKINPGIIMARVSGWGQDGPYSGKPGFASVAEAAGACVLLPDIRIAHLFVPISVLGILSPGCTRPSAFSWPSTIETWRGTELGQVVDVALYESVFNVMEGVVPDFDKLGMVRQREGNRLSG